MEGKAEMSDKGAQDASRERDPAKFLEALKEFVSNICIEEFIDLCRSCMQDDGTSEEVEDYFVATVREMAEELVERQQHLAAVQLVVRSAMPRDVAIHFISAGLKAHRRKKDVVRALIKLEHQIYNMDQQT
jgi:hypothetical protein